MWMKLFLMSLVAVMAHSLSLRDESYDQLTKHKKNSTSENLPNVIASLYFKKNSTRFCSAFFVSTKHVMTAYVCVRGKKYTDLEVGIYRDTQIAYKFVSKKIIPHPNAQVHVNNFAIVVLAYEMNGEATIFHNNIHPISTTIGHSGHFFKFTDEGQDHFKGTIEKSSVCHGTSYKTRFFCVSTKIQLSKTDIGGPLGVFYKNGPEYQIAVYTGYKKYNGKGLHSFESTYPVYDWISKVVNGTKA